MSRKSFIIAVLVLTAGPAFAVNSRAVIARPVETSAKAVEAIKPDDLKKERKDVNASGVAKATESAQSVNAHMKLASEADRIEMHAKNDRTCSADCVVTGEAIHDVLVGEQGLKGDAAKKALALAEKIDSREALDPAHTDQIQKTALAEAGISEKALRDSCLKRK